MPFGRLSPVSETDSESLHSSRNPSVDLRPKPLNFSRPKPQDIPSSRNLNRDGTYAASTSSSSSNAGGSIRGVGAAHDLPDEPRFSLDSDQDSLAPSTHSAGSELVWDPETGELRSKRTLPRRGSDYDAQRYTASGPPAASSTTPRRPPSSRSHPSAEHPLIAELPGDAPSAQLVAQQRQQRLEAQNQKLQDPSPTLSPKPSSTTLPDPQPRIEKRISLDQQSERLSVSSSLEAARTNTNNGGGGATAGWEDTRSHHTASELGGGGGGGDARTSQDGGCSADVSALGEKKLAKLRKKGINPQLYLEMKAARGGKGRLVGPLVGNTYLG